MLQAFKERLMARERVLNELSKFSEVLEERFGRATAILFGSYARGDFNLWSDIDLLLILDTNLPDSPLKRFRFIEDITPPGVEVHIASLDEFKKLCKNKRSYLNEMLKDAVWIKDSLNLKTMLHKK